MTSDGAALLRACLASPEDDDAPRVYADWLEETGDVERAEFVRRVTELGRDTGAVWISVEGITLLPDVAEQVRAGIRRHKGIFVVSVGGRPLATAHGHGDWVRALDPD